MFGSQKESIDERKKIESVLSGFHPQKKADPGGETERRSQRVTMTHQKQENISS
jgi:hypothetical protein